MTTDHYESAYGECETELSIDYTEQEPTVADAQYRSFWCPACGRTHNFRKLDSDETGDHRLAGAEPAEPTKEPLSGESDPEETGSPDANPGGSADTSDSSDDQIGLDELEADESQSRSEETEQEDEEVQEETVDDRVEAPPIEPADFTVGELENELDVVEYEWTPAKLRGLYEAEGNGKARSTALDAIGSKLEEELATEEE